MQVHADFRDVKNVNQGNAFTLKTGYSGKNQDHSVAILETMLIMVLMSLAGAPALRSDGFSGIIDPEDVRSLEKQSFGTDPESLPTTGALMALCH